MIKEPTNDELSELLDTNLLNIWFELIKRINELYDVDNIWNKGFGDWKYEYKFRRGGKTLCTLYMKKNKANILFTLGKVERDKYEEIKFQFSNKVNTIYDNTENFHDGKWLWIPIDSDWNDLLKLLKIKRKPNRKQL